MKKLMYLLVVGVMFAFTACGGGEATETTETTETVETVETVVEEATTHSHGDSTEHANEGDEAVVEESAE